MSRNPLFCQGEICFITTTVTAWTDVFTRQSFRMIVVDALNYCILHKGLTVYAWCIMSNHVHLIASATPAICLNDIVRDFKKFTSNQIVAAIKREPESRKEWLIGIYKYAGKYHRKKIIHKFWKDGFDCFELFSNHVIDQKVNYIHDNPVRAGMVDAAEDYVFSSARDYAGGKGLVRVELL